MAYFLWETKISRMKEKSDVLQGTLALMVLKTLDVLGPLHGYGIERRIEQISGDLLAVNQGTLYPVRLGRFRKQPPRALLSPHQRRPQAVASRNQRLATNVGHHRPLLRSQSRRPLMKSLRRLLARLFNVITRRIARDQDARLREEIADHIALQTEENLRAGLSPIEARRQAMVKFGG